MAKKGLLIASAATIAGIAALYKIGSDELKRRANAAIEDKDLEELFNETDENGNEKVDATLDDGEFDEDFEIVDSYDEETLVDIIRDGADVVKVGLDVVIDKVHGAYDDYKTDPVAFKANVKEYAVDKYDDAKDFASDKYEIAKDFATEKYGEAKDFASEKIDQAKDFATQKYEAAKDFATEKIDDVKIAASEKLDKAKDFATEKIDNLRDGSSLDSWEDDLEEDEPTEVEPTPIEGEIDVIEIESKKDKKKKK